MGNQPNPEDRPELIASHEDFESLDVDAILADENSLCYIDLESVFLQAARSAAGRGKHAAERACKLIAVLCSFRLDPEDPAGAWRSCLQDKGLRALLPSDLSSEQRDVLMKILKRINHPGIRARIADVVWTCDRSLASGAKIAINSYCAMVLGRLSGEFHRRSFTRKEHFLDVADWLVRILQISATIKGRKAHMDPIGEVLAQAYRRTQEEKCYVSYVRVAWTGLEHGLLGAEKVALDAEALARSADEHVYPDAVKDVLRLAASAYRRRNNEEGRQRCLKLVVCKTLAMRDRLESALARAAWTRLAIGELREASGSREEVEALRNDLSCFQEEARDELTRIPFSLSLGREPHDVKHAFEGLSLPECLFEFARLAESPSVRDLQEFASTQSPISRIFPMALLDPERRVVRRVTWGQSSREKPDSWVTLEVMQHLGLWRVEMVESRIEPARQVSALRFPMEARQLGPIVASSLFVPPGREGIFAFGLAKFWQGDHVSAAHLLYPQIENSLRYLLACDGVDSSKIRPDLTQEDRALSGLWSVFRSNFESLLGEDLAWELNFLFNDRLGPALRHQLAHGKLDFGDCFRPNVIYGNWFIYRITCLLVQADWRTQLAPWIVQCAA